jgi:hypothetical protein
MIGNILILDIEWRPTKAWVWRAWDETVQPDQIIDDGGVLCVGLKWLGKRKRYIFSEWEHGKKGMLKETHAMLSQADAVVTYNGDKYDLPKLNGEFLRYGFPSPPAPTSIDLIKTVKKLGFFMNRLAFIGPFLGLGGKVSHEGFSLWTKVMKGDEAAIKRMTRYCLKDITLTEQLYKRVRPYIRNHPYMGNTSPKCCGACGSKQLQSRGVRRTKAFRIQRLHCQGCGSWQDGKREKV